MEHVVFFRGPDGSEGFRRAAGIEEAVRYVEHLRNAEGVDDCAVYSLTEVPLRVKTVYVVEVPGQAPAPPPAAPSLPDPLSELTVPAMPVPEPAMPVAELPEPPVAEEPPMPSMPDADFAPVEVPAAEPVAGNGKGSGPRGLGFFAR